MKKYLLISKKGYQYEILTDSDSLDNIVRLFKLWNRILSKDYDLEIYLNERYYHECDYHRC